MVYVAELAPVLAEAERVLAAGGLLAFTTETHDGEGVVIGEGLRYAHALPMCAPRSNPPASNCPCWKIAPPATRTTCPVPGLVVVAAKT